MKHYLLLSSLISLLLGCSSESSMVNDKPSLPLTSGGTECVSLKTNMGNIAIKLEDQKAPESVSNFIGYVNTGFYDDLVFHRVIKNFMIQGGGFNSSLQRKQPNSPIANEAGNGLLNVRGSIAMARTASAHSATSEFFINTIDNDFLNFKNQTTSGWGYAVFGSVISGMDVVDAISLVNTGSQGEFSDVPDEPVVINKAEVISCSDI